MIAKKIVEIEPVAGKKTLFQILFLCFSLTLQKLTFGRIVLELAKQGKIFLHQIIHPFQSYEETRKIMVTDRQGSYYMGVVLWR